MDCKTARLLLDFARPQARELEAEEAQALESHLDRCPDCHSQASHERQLDDHLGKAMRQVEVPAGLREQLLARLESARGDWHRQRFAHAARLTAAAAALLIIGWAGWYWVREHWVTPIDTQRVANSISNDAAEDPIARTRRQLKALGADTPLSRHLDYHLLACPPFLTELPGYPGRMVPGLLFVRNGQVARVYLIREQAIPEKTLDAIDGGSFKAQLVDWEGEPYCFLVIHDGEDLGWLQPPQQPAL
jgi:hypothetical protein